MSESLLEAEDLGWTAGGRRIVGPLGLVIRRGECLAVIGQNGAGKTSLLRLLAGLLVPTRGAVRWRGAPLEGLARRERARRIAYVPQVRPARVPFTVEEMVLLGRYPHLAPLQMAPRPEDFAAVRRALDQVGLGGLGTRRLEELSGGERQAVYIAAALAQEAELLVLDEPTSHLDPRHQLEVAALLRRLVESAGRTVVCATHDLNFAAAVSHRVLALADGRERFCGAPGETLTPQALGDLFEAPFTQVRGGERPLAVLELA